MNYRFYSLTFFWCLTLSFLSQLIFSKYGFNPTDDGMIFADSKRLLSGQIPHLDFISIRPTLSALIHLPELYFFKENLLFFSRFVVLIQFSLVSFFWYQILMKAFKLKISITKSCLILSFSFILSLHNFPLMSWATIDAIFFISLGIFLYYCFEIKRTGFILVSISYLFKQSFIFVPFFFFIFTKDFRKYSYFFVIFLPGILYFSLISNLGGYNDLILQLSSGSGLSLFLGINLSHIKNFHIWIGLISMTIIHLLFISKKINLKFLIIFFKAYLSILFIYLFYFSFLGEFIKVSQILFGGVLSVILFSIYEKGFNDLTSLMVTAFVTAWSVSLSQGYPEVTLFSGVLANILIFYLISEIEFKKIFFTSSLIFLFTIFIAFYDSRLNNVYRELESKELTFDLGEVLEGAKNIKTNKNIHSLFSDLNNLINKNKNKNLAVVPDMQFYWAKSEILNPLSADWLQNIEVPGENLQKRIYRELKNLAASSEGLIIVQKYKSSTMAEKLEDYSKFRDYSFSLEYIKKNFKLVEETAFFEVYGN